MSETDIGIVIGTRSILSLIGLQIMFAGLWIRERRWDDQGEQAYNKYIETVDGNYRAVEDGQQHQQQAQDASNLSEPYQSMSDKAKNFHDDGSRDVIQISSSDAEDRLPLPRTLQRELEGLLPIPMILLFGCLLFMISLIFSPQPGVETKTYSGWNIPTICMVPIFIAIYIFGVPRSIFERKPALKKQLFQASSAFFVLMCVFGLIDDQINSPWFFCTLAAIFIPLSFYVLHRARKMGAIWDETARPNKQAAFNNGVFFLMVVGFYCLWAGLNAVDTSGYESPFYMPLGTGLRGWFAAIGGMGLIVPAHIALDYAFEKDSEVTVNGLSGNVLAKLFSDLGLGMESLARALESPFLSIVGWLVLCLTIYLPFKSFTIQLLLASLLGALAGLFYNFMVLPTYWSGNLTDHSKFVYIYCAAMISFAVLLGLNSVSTMVLSVLGTVMILLGQFLDLLEQKKGRFWLQERIDNPSLSLFGIGQPLLVFGWILLCQAIALPIVSTEIEY